MNKYGCHMACGDVDGDGYDEIVTGPGPGRVFGPHVRGWDHDGEGITAKNISYKAYGTAQFGAEVACGDVDGDGYAEIITGPGPGPLFGPHVLGWDYDGTAIKRMSAVNYFAYGLRAYGVRVTCGNINGEGAEEIITGPGPGSFLGAHVKGWEVGGDQARMLPGMSFLAYESKYGAYVSAGAAGEDGRSCVLTGPGPGSWNGALVKVWAYRDGTVCRDGKFRAFGFRYGVIPAVHTFWY
jgi:hypothetical protein